MSERPISAVIRHTRPPWRRCSSCGGVCHWHDEAWVCRDCGDEWYPDHGKQYTAPDERSITGGYDE